MTEVIKVLHDSNLSIIRTSEDNMSGLQSVIINYAEFSLYVTQDELVSSGPSMLGKHILDEIILMLALGNIFFWH